MMRRCLLLMTIALLPPLPIALGAVGMTWSTAGAQQFAEGKLQGVSVRSTGEVELAPEREDIEGLTAEFVWDLAAGEDGTVYAATVGPPAVYAVRDRRAELLHTSDQKVVLSVLALPDGSVLAGTGPNGIIHRISRAGRVTTFADLEAAYVWDMALGPHSEIYCATGPTGKLYRLNRAGEGAALLELKQKNLMCLAVAPDGTVYVGTDTDGYVYRVDGGGRATLIHDADEDEVHALYLDAEDRLYACTAQGEESARPGPPAGSADAHDPPPMTPPPAAGPPGAFISIYRILPERGAERLLRIDRVFMLSLAPMGEQVLLGTGAGGRVFGVGPSPVSRVVTELDAAHVTAMVAAGAQGVIVGTGSPGGLFRLRPGMRRTGTYLSKPFDATYLSRWGRLWWRHVAGGIGSDIRVRVRTGNSSEPDDHWSDWSPWAADPDGEALDRPAGRFAQFAAELRGAPGVDGPRLVEVGISYLQDNRRPRIEDLLVDGQSVLGKSAQGEGGRPRRPSNSSSRDEQKTPPSLRQVGWQAADPNEDELIYTLYCRALDETEWRLVAEDVRADGPHVWDTSRVPDGLYVLKLVAGDRLARPGPEALTDERVSIPVLIDNRGPAVRDLRAIRRPDGSFRITGTVRDELSSITKIEVSQNADDWQPVFPDDAMLDAREEAFGHETDVLEPGEHVFVFAAADARGNQGSGKVVVQVP